MLQRLQVNCLHNLLHMMQSLQWVGLTPAAESQWPGSLRPLCVLALQLQILHEQTASKLPLAEMQLVELRAQRLEGLQVCL